MPIWIVVVGWLTKIVLVVLLGLSVWSVKVILERKKVLEALDDADVTDELRRLIEEKNFSVLKQKVGDAKTLRLGLFRQVVESGLKKPELVEHAVKSYTISKRAILEKDFTILSTLGSNAPFVGLFGTVLGIIQAFGVLASPGASSQGSAMVMAGISEALVATAVGLFVAIPAVVAFNTYNRRVKNLMSECESLKELYLSRMES